MPEAKLPASTLEEPKPKKKKKPVEKEVYLVGTVHVSRKSMERVDDTIRTVLPDFVCLELDLQRFKNMQQEMQTQVGGEDVEIRKPTKGGEGGQFRYSGGGAAAGSRVKAEGPKLSKYTIPRGKRAHSGGFFSLGGLLHWLQESIGREFGVMPGSEMYAATGAAKKYGLNIALIDRPVEVTLNRMWGGMGFREKMKLLGYLGVTGGVLLLKPMFGKKASSIMSMFGESKEIDLNKLEKGEGVEELMDVLKEKFPSIYTTLVDERNEAMAKSIQNILSTRGDRLVVVVGMGHIKGMEKLLKEKGISVRVV